MAIRTLIVNCNSDRAEVLRQVLGLTSKEFRVVGQSESGTDGLALARASRPDLVITCIGLEGLSGLDLAAAVRRESPTTRIIIGTSRADMRQQSMAAGADAFFEYPLDILSFQALLRSVTHLPVEIAIPRASSTATREAAEAIVATSSVIASPAEGASAVRRALDILANPGTAIGAYFALAIVYVLFGLDRSEIAGALFGGTFGVFFLFYFIATLIRRQLLSKEEKKAEDKYNDWLSGQRGP